MASHARFPPIVSSKFRSYPFLFSSSFFALGILLGNLVEVSLYTLIAASAGLIVVGFLIRKRQIFNLILALSFVHTGCLTLHLHRSYCHKVKNQSLEPGKYRAWVLDIKEGKHSERLTCAYIISLSRPHRIQGKLQIVLYRPKNMGIISSGDAIEFYLNNLQINSRPNNPYEFDFGRYMFREKIIGSGFVQSIKPLSTYKMNFYIYVIKLRSYLSQYLRSNKWNTDQKAIIQSIAYGYKKSLSPELRTSFSSSGMAHVLAVSGLHVGILFSMIHFLLSRLRRLFSIYSPKIYLLSIPLIWGYALTSGFEASVVRASLMISLYIINRFVLYKNLSPIEVVMTTFLIILSVDPWSLFSPGFQLSFSAVIVLVYFSRKIHIRSKRLSRFKLIQWGITSVGVSILATLATMPFLLYHFHSYSILGPATSLMAIPLTYVIMISSLLMIFTPLKSLMEQIAGQAAQFMISLSEHSEQMILLHQDNVWYSLPVIILGSAALLLFAIAHYCTSKIVYKWSITLCMGSVVGLHCLYKTLDNPQKSYIIYHDYNTVQLDVINRRDALLIPFEGSPKHHAYLRAIGIRRIDTLQVPPSSAILIEDHGVQYVPSSSHRIHSKANVVILGRRLRYFPFDQLCGKTVILPANVNANFARNIYKMKEKYNIDSLHRIAKQGPFIYPLS